MKAFKMLIQFTREIFQNAIDETWLQADVIKL